MKAAKVFIFIAFFALLCAVVKAADEKPSEHATVNSQSNAASFKQPGTLAELLALPPSQLEEVDLARMNLLCAEGLRGSEDMDIERCLKTLDVLAEHVKNETERSRHFFAENPARFKNSEGYFRMMYLATVVQQDFGVQYNPERKNDFTAEDGKQVRQQSNDIIFADSKDHFINGLLAGKHYGTCFSMPMLYVAVARRLGYPVYFATTQTHGYVRYEEGTNHINVEATCVGFKTYPDAFYKNWPYPLSDEFIKQLHHLQSLDNKTVLGHCLVARSSCLMSMKKHDEAEAAWNEAMRYLPDSPLLKRHSLTVKLNRDRSRWLDLWQEVDKLEISDGPKFSYFQNKKLRVHMFMNHSYDMDAMDKVVAKLKEEVTEYRKQTNPLYDGPQTPVAIWPENLDDLPEFPAETVSMPSLAASREYWRAIPPEFVAQLQQMGATKDEEVLEEVTRLSLSRASYLEEERNALLPPQVQMAMQQIQAAQQLSRSSPSALPSAMSSRLVETFTRLADNEGFRMALSQYHTAKLRQLEKEMPIQTFEPTITISHNGTVRVSEKPFRPQQPMGDERNPNAALDELRRRTREQEKFYHLQSISALATKSPVKLGEPNPVR